MIKTKKKYFKSHWTEIFLFLALLLNFTSVLAINLTEKQKLVASDGAAGDEFGSSTRLNDDLLVVGAPGHGAVASFSGAAYVFRYDGNTWIEEQKLLGSGQRIKDLFGHSVEICDDQILIGAGTLNNSTNIGIGSVYVFEKSGSNWIEVDRLFGSDAQISDGFGAKISCDGSFLAVGSHWDDDGGSNAGAVFIFERTGGQWSEVQKLVASDALAGDFFGFSQLEMSTSNLLIPSFASGTLGYRAGGAYSFQFNGSNWTDEQKLVASDGMPQDFFGGNLSLNGSKLAISSIQGDAPSVPNAGALYIFEKSGGTWGEIQKLNASNAISGARFGGGTEFMGSNVLAVGAPRENRGAVYIYEDNGNGWIESLKVVASNLAPDADFGERLAFDNNQLAVSDRIGSTRAGSVYIFEADIAPPDTDDDGIPDDEDNCPSDFNTDQADLDNDGQGDVCDTDDDSDGVLDDVDNCPMSANTDQADLDNDGQGDVCDTDDDGDGVDDTSDSCPISDTSASVVIDGCDSGVSNTVQSNGCTVLDDISACAANASNHGKFVSCVSKLTNSLKKAGLITGQQKGAIQSCAAQANIP